MEIANKLHKLLEHNRVRPDRHSPRNIRPVFLDTGELPLLENLDDGIYQALDNSECLIVICSPNLPLSKYCMREISYFKKIHGGQTSRIYTVLAAGTPEESFPEILRTTTRIVRDENGNEREVTEEVEPLFANVAAPTLRQSLKKLKKTEYLRLAAAYYRCSFDQLYKRHRRWVIRNAALALCALALIATGFWGYAMYRNHQYNAAKAETFASYAESQAQNGDELLAITLCREGWEAAQISGSQRLQAVLRSAQVQHDYKLRAEPAAPVTKVDYYEGTSPIFYLNSDGTRMILHSDYYFLIVDANSGEIYHQFPGDSTFVLGSVPDKYVTVEAIQDENGVPQDTASVWTVKDSRLIGRIPFRQSSQAAPQYKVISKQNKSVLYLQDHDQIVLCLDEDGNRLTLEEADALQQSAASAVSDQPFQIARRRGKGACVKNSNGDILLELDEANPMTVLSPDGRYFGAVQGNALTVYETGAFTAVGQIEVDKETLHYLYLLDGTDYAMCVFDTATDKKAELWDWRSGLLLLEENGYAHVSKSDHSFSFMYDGTLTRYVYRDMDVAGLSFVVAQRGSLCLTRRDDQVRLADGETGRTLLLQEGLIRDVRASGDLNRILILTDAARCYDSAGALLWTYADVKDIMALAEDGNTAAFVNGSGDVTVVDGNTGAAIYTLPSSSLDQIYELNELAVSDGGLCALGIYGGLWFPAGENQGQWLEDWSGAKLYKNGLLALENAYAYVMDFQIRNVKTGETVCLPGDNTGLWVYSEASGYLVRQRETSGNHKTLQLEVLRLENGAFAVKDQIWLPERSVTDIALDSSGNYLSVTVNGTTLVYFLPDMQKILSAKGCSLRYEAGRFWNTFASGTEVYSIACLRDEELYQTSMKAIAGINGARELSTEEKAHYSFDKK